MNVNKYVDSCSQTSKLLKYKNFRKFPDEWFSATAKFEPFGSSDSNGRRITLYPVIACQLIVIVLYSSRIIAIVLYLLIATVLHYGCVCKTTNSESE